MPKIIFLFALILSTSSFAKTHEYYGYRMSGITEGSVQDRAGLQNGDIVKKVNGAKVRIKAPKDALALYNKFSEPGTQLEVFRDGKTIRLIIQ